jgi:hypothetical protein
MKRAHTDRHRDGYPWRRLIVLIFAEGEGNYVLTLNINRSTYIDPTMELK